jgi:AcrR family transcriptional regulator
VSANTTARTVARADTRDTILEAANRIVVRDGASKLTLDAVAREAGISKGGLLYHFGSRNALILGMIEADVARVQARLDHLTDGSPGSWTRAYIQDTINVAMPTDLELNTSFIAALAENPELIEPFRTASHEWQQRTENDGIDPVTATIIRLAVDGMYFSELFDLAPPDSDLRERILNRLIEMTQPTKP